MKEPEIFRLFFLNLSASAIQMKNIFLLSLLALCVGCSKNSYDPETYLPKPDQQRFLLSIVRYSDKLPPRSSHATKFDHQFDEYYQEVAKSYNIKSYYISDDQTHFVLVTRPARSITPMREAIGIKIKYDSKKEIALYEEIFRTWKMPEEKLNERYPILFEKMIAGESLEEFYSKNAGDQYIEFPDDRFYFDKTERKWRDKIFDSLKVEN